MRAEKQSMIEDVRRCVKNAGFVFMVDFTGQDVERFGSLRRKLKAEGSEIHVVRNRFLKKVTQELGWRGVEAADGTPTAIVTGTEETPSAKIIWQFASMEEKPLVIKGGFLKGDFVSGDEVKSIAALPPRATALGMLVGTIAAPMSRLVGVLNQAVAQVVYVLKAAEAKKA